MREQVVAFLPCRSGSQRVPKKNTRDFLNIEGGLTTIKLKQLFECTEIDRIVVSTDDEKVADIANVMSKKNSTEIEILERPVELATSETSTDMLIGYVPTIIDSGIVLWAHVTSPFVTAKIYDNAIHAYYNAINDGEFDSLMSVTKIQTFLWDKNGPVNYDQSKEKWPRTQTLPEWFEVNSAFFIADISVYLNFKDRIGEQPFLFELSDVETIDIDWESDFLLAENLWRSRNSLKGVG